MSEIANPREYLPHLIVWSTFNIFAALAIAALLLVTLISQRRDADRALLNLEAIFVLTSASGSILVWTGHALDAHPPHALCLFNAAIGMANVPLMAGSALAVVLKVWGSVMIACHMRTRGVVQWIIWKPFLLALPYLSGLPLFIAGLVIGTRDPSKVYRGSPLYCVVDNPAVQNTASALGAAYTFSCLVLAAWTTVNLITTRWRVRRIIEYPGVSYSFVCRTLFFSIFVSVAFVVGILSLVSTFSAIVPDVVLSSCAVAVFFIFSTAKPIINFVFCRRHGAETVVVLTAPKPKAPFAAVHVSTRTTGGDAPRFALKGSTAGAPSLSEPDDYPEWRLKVMAGDADTVGTETGGTAEWGYGYHARDDGGSTGGAHGKEGSGVSAAEP